MAALEVQLKAAKDKLAQTYESKGKTDFEVLAIGAEVDRLINEYERVLKEEKKKYSEFKYQALRRFAMIHT